MNTIFTNIQSVANNKLNGKYNLAQYAEGKSKHAEKVAAMTHKAVCEQIVAFVESHPQIPVYFTLAVGVNMSAMKATEYAKGYKKFNAAKVEAVYEMGRLYYEYNGIANRKLSDVTIRLMTRYYDNVSSDVEDFKVSLAASKVLGKACGERTTDYNALCKNLGIPQVNRKAKESENKAA